MTNLNRFHYIWHSVTGNKFLTKCSHLLTYYFSSVSITTSKIRHCLLSETTLHTRATFSQSLMVYVGVSKLGCTELIGLFIPEEKINGQSVLQGCSAAGIRHVSRNMLTFQQDSAPAHRAWDMIELLYHSTPDFTTSLLQTCGHLTYLVHYAIWSIMQQRVYQTRVHDIDELQQRLITVWCK